MAVRLVGVSRQYDIRSANVSERERRRGVSCEERGQGGALGGAARGAALGHFSHLTPAVHFPY